MITLFRLGFIVLLLSLCSCGWHLRGSFNHGTTNDLHFVASDPFSELSIAFKESMQQRAIENNKEALIRLSVDEEHLNKRTVAVTNIGSPSQYELSLSVDYHYSSPEQLSPSLPKTISVQRVFDFDPSNTVAKREEENMLLNEMRRELAHRILQQASNL